MSIKEFIFCITKKWTHWQIFSKMLPTFHEHFRVAASIILFVFFLARSIFLKTKIEPYSNVLGEIILSLNRCNLIICRKDQAFSNWFFVNLTPDKFVKALQIDCLRPGSNEQKVDLECYKTFKEMLDIAFHDGKMKEVFL